MDHWLGKDPATNRTTALLVKFTESEIALTNDKAEKPGMTQPNLIIEAARTYQGKKSAGK